MLGLGLSITSPLIIQTAVEAPEPAQSKAYPVGTPGPSTGLNNYGIVTETFYRKVIDQGGGVSIVHTYEAFIPTLSNLSGVAGLPLSSFAPTFFGSYLIAAATLTEIVGINPDMDSASDFALATDDDLILGGEEGETVFKKFMKYLYTSEEEVTEGNYSGREFFFAEAGESAGTALINGYTGTDATDADLDVLLHDYAFAGASTINAIASIFSKGEFEYYVDFLESDQYPGDFQITGPSYSQGHGILFRVNTETVTELVQLPQFGIAPTALSLLSGSPELVAGDFGFTSETELILGGVPNTNDNGVYRLNFSIEENYVEENGEAISGTDLFPLGMHDDGNVPISTFHTNFTIEYADGVATTTIPATIVYTNAGSFTTVVGTFKLKSFSYTGTLDILEEDFPALYASTDNGSVVYPAVLVQMVNVVPESDTYTPSNIVSSPFGNQVNLPLIGTTSSDLLEWLTFIDPDVPGTSLSLIPATDNTYDATPPATNPTITHYSSTLPLKGVHVDFSAGVADLSTAYATSGTDFTFIAIGINKNVSSSTEQFIVNRKSTAEGLGIKSDATYIKLKNATIPTDTTPAGVPAQDYQNFTPFFLYVEKNSAVISEYNEFNEEVKRYSGGANDILELDRITDNFAGSLSYIAVKDTTLSNTQRAKFIESLRTKYLDLNVINRHG